MARVAIDNVVIDQRLSLFEIGDTDSAGAVRRQYGVDRAEIANDTIDIIASEVDVLRSQYRDPERFRRALAENLRSRFTRIEGNRDELTVQAGEIERIVADLTDVETGLQTRATIDQLQQAQSDNESARGEIASSIRAEYTASDDALENEINNRATISELQLAQATNEEARSELSRSLQADYNGQLNAKAEITYVDQAVSDEAGARARQYSDLSATSTANLLEIGTDEPIRNTQVDLYARKNLPLGGSISASYQGRETFGSRIRAFIRVVRTDGSTDYFLEPDVNQSGPYITPKRENIPIPSNATAVRFQTRTTLGNDNRAETLTRRFMVNAGPVAAPYTNPGASLDQSGRVIENNEVAISAEHGPFAEATRQVSTTDGERTASIQEQMLAIGGLRAQWSVKAQTPDPNKPDFVKVSGIGYASEPADDGGVLSAIHLAADILAVMDPADTTGASATFPFIVKDGTVYMDRAMIEVLQANDLSAISAYLGTVIGGTFKTADGTGNRVEMSSEGAYALWGGSGAKNATNAKWYVDQNGNLVVNDATMNAANIIGTAQIQGNAVTRTTTAQRLTKKEFGRYEEGHVLTLAIPPTNTGENETALLAFSSNYEFDDDSATETASLRINSTLEGDIFDEVVEEDRLPDARKNFSLQIPVQIRHNSYTYIRMYMTLGGDNVKAVYFAYMTCLDLYDE